MSNDLTPARPQLQQLQAASELLGTGWVLLAPEDEHYVIDADDGCVAAVNGDSSSFYLDIESCEALAYVVESLGNLLEYVGYLERVNARLEHRYEQRECIAA